ncbi:MAG: metal-sensitive transcriptional regulator [Deltaproteobacteria bacterium]|nr:metal-sensitive transcriptional regulator [Deltaproteobacteria bacterium]
MSAKTKKQPDYSVHLSKLNRVIGQLEGVRRMIGDHRYGPDIMLQVRAATAALKTVEVALVETHVRTCVSQVLSSSGARNARTHIDELVKVVGLL